LKKIEPAEKNVFKLIFSKDNLGNISILSNGRIRVEGGKIHLDYKNNTDEIGVIQNSSAFIRTLHKNLLPLYVRAINKEIWISNDVCELLIEGEEVPIRMVEILDAAAGSNGNRNALSHLLDQITILMPSSYYRISQKNDGLVIDWIEFYFNYTKNATKEEYLNYLIEQYRVTYLDSNEICLALSGGYDSRLELAIFTHLKKNVHCFHYKTSKRESDLAKVVAETAGASFTLVSFEELISPGWDFLKHQGYLTRWDGFFAPAAITASGLYLKMINKFPGEVKCIMGTDARRYYRPSKTLMEFYLLEEERRFTICQKYFPQYVDLLKVDKERRQIIITRLISAIFSQCAKDGIAREDIINDIVATFLSFDGKHVSRSSFLFENGAPYFTSRKNIWDFLISLPQQDKEKQNFLTWAIKTLDPRLDSLPYMYVSRSIPQRTLNSLARLPVFGKIIFGNYVDHIKIGDSQEWLRDSDVEYIMEILPDIRLISKKAKNRKSELYIAQICRFLKTIQEKKKVSFKFIR